MKCAEYFYNLNEAKDFYEQMKNAAWNAVPELNDVPEKDDEGNETWIVFYNPKPII